MKPSVCAIIPARAGSKGLPGKNLKLLNGLPLLAHSILQAMSADSVERIFLSTDCPEIARVGDEHGAEVPFLRPQELAEDTSSVVDAVEHLVDGFHEYTPDYILLLQPTSPLRLADDIDQAFALLQSSAAPAVVGVCEAQSHPYLCKTIEESGVIEPFFDHALNGARRQDLPSAYTLNGSIYLIRTEVLLDTRTWCPEGTVAHVMPAERSVDIDTEIDFAWAEWLMQYRNQRAHAA